jgi:DNA-binding NarL/FixJ family response regulator
MRVLIVHDHPVTRDGLKTSFGSTDEIDVVGEAASGEEAIKLAQDLAPDVVFMGVRMPGRNGIQATRIIRERHPDTNVVILATDDGPETRSEVIQAGASAYLPRDASVNDLVRAAKQAMAGDAAGLSEARLSPREIEVLEKVADGVTTKEVAHQLGISVHAERKHLDDILEKLRVNDRFEAAAASIPSRGTAEASNAYGWDSVQLCPDHDRSTR